MPKILTITGLSGAGKTTLLNRVSAKRLKVKYRVVNVGTLMAETALREGTVVDRDELKGMSKRGIERLRERAFRSLMKMEGNVLLDTHLTVESGPRMVPGLPKDAIKSLGSVVGLVYIDAPSSEIIARRKKDKSRKREMQDEFILDSQRSIDFATLAYYSSDLNISLYIINNRDGFLKDAVNGLERTLADAFGD